MKKYIHKIIINNWIKLGLALAATPLVSIIVLILIVLVRYLNNIISEIKLTGQWWLIPVVAFILSLAYLSVEPKIYIDRKINQEVASLILYWKDRLARQNNPLPTNSDIKAIREVFLERLIRWDPYGVNACFWKANFPDETYPNHFFGIVDSYLEYCDKKKALKAEKQAMSKKDGFKMEDKIIFTESYINKCIKYKNDIIILTRCFAKCVFEIGDYFHHPATMDPNEVKMVREIICQDLLSAGTPGEEYLINDCIFIPTDQQLAKGFEAHRLPVNPAAYGGGPEKLLDEYLNRKNKL